MEDGSCGSVRYIPKIGLLTDHLGSILVSFGPEFQRTLKFEKKTMDNT
jgi:hypothetical protein